MPEINHDYNNMKINNYVLNMRGIRMELKPSKGWANAGMNIL